MYVRKIDDQEINLRVSGMLWDYSLIMQDEETESLWSHILGDCVQGQHKGKSLEMLPSVLTDLASWKADHPDSTVMNWPHGFEQNWKRDAYEKLSYDKFAIGLSLDGKNMHFRFPDLRAQPLVNFTFENRPLVLRFDPETGAAWCYDRVFKGQKLEFALRENKMVDRESGSIWNRQSGLALSGLHSGERLNAIVVIPSQVHAWKTFHPDSHAWQRREIAGENAGTTGSEDARPENGAKSANGDESANGAEADDEKKADDDDNSTTLATWTAVSIVRYFSKGTEFPNPTAAHWNPRIEDRDCHSCSP